MQNKPAALLGPYPCVFAELRRFLAKEYIDNYNNLHLTTLLSLQAQIAELQQKAAQIKTKEFASTVADIQAKMRAFGITVADLKAAQSKPKAGRKGRKPAADKALFKRSSKLAGVKVEPKYRNTDGQTWTGRGVAPKWMTIAIAAGGKRKDFLIN